MFGSGREPGANPFLFAKAFDKRAQVSPAPARTPSLRPKFDRAWDFSGFNECVEGGPTEC